MQYGPFGQVSRRFPSAHITPSASCENQQAFPFKQPAGRLIILQSLGGLPAFTVRVRSAPPWSNVQRAL
ncbi:hypothetical protein M3J09_012152 [Ascochyta lentis]